MRPKDPCITETKAECLGEGSERQSRGMAPPLPQDSRAPQRSPLSPLLLQWGQTAPPALQDTAGAPTLIPHQGDGRGIRRAHPLGICDREWGGAHNQHTILAVRAGSAHTGMPTSISSHLQNQGGGTSWPGNGWGAGPPDLAP